MKSKISKELAAVFPDPFNVEIKTPSKIFSGEQARSQAAPAKKKNAYFDALAAAKNPLLHQHILQNWLNGINKYIPKEAKRLKIPLQDYINMRIEADKKIKDNEWSQYSFCYSLQLSLKLINIKERRESRQKEIERIKSLPKRQRKAAQEKLDKDFPEIPKTLEAELNDHANSQEARLYNLWDSYFKLAETMLPVINEGVNNQAAIAHAMVDILSLGMEVMEYAAVNEYGGELKRIPLLKKERDELALNLEAVDRTHKRYMNDYAIYDQWATVPDCVRCIADMLLSEKELRGKAKNIKADTIRKNIQKYLISINAEVKNSRNSNFYRLPDIAEAAEKIFPDFTNTQYLREFGGISSSGDNLKRATKPINNKSLGKV